jgi:glyoxylase-like metal-dependent hydrolase (beta-lactamase superfamily II)
MAEDVCREAWLRLEEQTLGGRPLTRIFVTHDHPDHMGLAPWLAARHGLPVGYSDHTAGLHAPLTAIARGAAVVEVHFAAQGTVPRRNSWDKDREDLTTIVMFRDAVEQMMAPGRMLWESREARPHVGRWQH